MTCLLEHLGQEIEKLADAAEVCSASPSVDRPFERFQPFPVDALPEPLATFVRVASKAIGCDPTFLVLPILVVAAAMIGTSCVLELKRGWRVPSVLWAGIVGESGTMKTPAMKLALQPVKKRQAEALRRYHEAMQQYQSEKAAYEKDMAAWKRSRRNGELPPVEPKSPTAERCLVSDITIEAMAIKLLENPRGVLLAMDELAGWFGSFDRYTNGNKGSDAAHWLSAYNAESITVDRKTGEPKMIFVPTAAISVVGGIQPGILNRALGLEHRENGMLARLLLACPPQRSEQWTEAEIDAEVESQYGNVINRLASLEPAYDENGEPVSMVLQLSPEAKRLWTQFYNANAAELANLTGDLAAAWSKLEEIAARLALVSHRIKTVQAAPPQKPWLPDAPVSPSANIIDGDTMRDAIRLTEWFKAEIRRVYAMLGESDDVRDQRRLVEWIDRHGGAATASKVQSGCRWLRNSGMAEIALNGLAKAGLGSWSHVPSGPQGGRPSHVFRLSERRINETSPFSLEKAGLT